MSDNTNKNRVEILGNEIDSLTGDEMLAQLDRRVQQNVNGYVCFCEAHLCVRSVLEHEVWAALRDAEMVLADGVAMTAGARLLGSRIPERLSGPSVMLAVCEHGLERGYRHFFYGGREGVAEQLVRRLTRRFPSIEIAGTYCPPFRALTDREEADVKRRIEDSRADILWVGLGAPKQELWMAQHVGKINVPVMMGVGAAFDFHSGNRRWAPGWVRKAGLEWVYRMVTGGPRVFLRNAKYESLFTVLILKQAIGMRLKRVVKAG